VPVKEERSTASKANAWTAINAAQGRNDLLDHTVSLFTALGTL
jgi:hypothetical protein